MSRIRAYCSNCGEVVVDSDDVRPDAVAERPPGHEILVFRCPRCARWYRATVDSSAARALLRAGVGGRRPARTAATGSRHPEAPPNGPPLCLDDLLDLHLLLETDDWFSTLRWMVRASETR